MSTPVETTIRTHLRANDAVQETIDWAEIVARLDIDTPLVANLRQPRRFRVWVAVAAAVLTVLLIGLIPLLVRNEETANTIVPTTLTESLPPVTGGVIGPGSWSVAATFPDGSLSPAQAAEAVTQVEAWPGVLGVVAVQDESAWRQLTGLVSDCGDGKVLPPCGPGVVVLATVPWMARVAERLESEFGMEAISALDVPAEFWDGYVERVSSSQVALVFDPGALGTEQPLNGPIFEVSGEVCDSDDCDVVVENEVDGFSVVAGVGFDSDGVGIVLGGIGGAGFSINELLVDRFGNGGAIAVLDAWTDDESPIGVRRIYAVAGLPIDAAVVTMELADGTRVWQRPVGGMAFFVDNVGSMPERFRDFYDQDGAVDEDELEDLGPVRPLVVLDRDGTEIMRIEDAGDGRTLVTDLRFAPDAVVKAVETQLPALESAEPVEVTGLGTLTWTEVVWSAGEGPDLWTINAASNVLLGTSFDVEAGDVGIWNSVDGETWERIFTDLTDASMAVDGPVAVVAGTRSDGTQALFISDDGENWSDVDHSTLPETGRLKVLETTRSGLTKFVVTGIPEELFGVIVEGRLVDVHFPGVGRTVGTQDGVMAYEYNWNLVDPPSSRAQTYLGGGQWTEPVEIPPSRVLRVGDTVLVIDQTNATCCGDPIVGISEWPILASNNGIDWTEVSSLSAENVHTLELEAGEFFWVIGPSIGGGGTRIEVDSTTNLWISTDGINWQSFDVGFTSIGTELGFVHVAGDFIYITYQFAYDDDPDSFNGSWLGRVDTK